MTKFLRRFVELNLLVCCGIFLWAAHRSWQAYDEICRTAVGRPVESQVDAYRVALDIVVSGIQMLCSAAFFAGLYLFQRTLTLAQDLAAVRARLPGGE